MKHLNRLPRTLSPCRIKPSSDDKSPLGSDLEISYFYENGLPYSVKVVLRSGLCVTVPPHGNVGINNLLTTRVYDFVVRMRIKHSRHVKIDTNGILDGIHTEEQSRELYAMAIAAKSSNQHYAGTWYDFSVDYHVSRDQFEDNIEQGVYVPEVDLTIVKADVVDVVHPLSAAGAAITANESSDLLGYLYRIEIVDPYDQFGTRFVNIAGQIDRVIPIKDLKREPGVYVHRVLRTDLSKPADIKPEVYTFDEAVKVVRLYRTEDEARALGDLAEAQKREIESQKQTYETATHELKMKIINAEAALKEEAAKNKQAIADYDLRKREIDELKEVISTLRTERLSKLKEQQEVRSMAREDHYESRSASRKDDSEWLKWVPAVVVGGGLLAYKLFWD